MTAGDFLEVYTEPGTKTAKGQTEEYRIKWNVMQCLFYRLLGRYLHSFLYRHSQQRHCIHWKNLAHPKAWRILDKFRLVAKTFHSPTKIEERPFLGPLLYHFADLLNEESIELTYEELKEVLVKVGFQIIVSLLDSLRYDVIKLVHYFLFPVGRKRRNMSLRRTPKTAAPCYSTSTTASFSLLKNLLQMMKGLLNKMNWNERTCSQLSGRACKPSAFRCPNWLNL